MCFGAGWAWSAGLFSAAPAADAAAEAAHLAAAERAEHLAFTEVYLSHETRAFTVGRGETFAGLLTRAGATPGEATNALVSIAGVYDTRRIRPGQPVNLIFERGGANDARLTAVAFRSEPGASVTANRTLDGEFAAREVLMPLTFEIARIASQVQTSLYGTALALGATDREVPRSRTHSHTTSTFSAMCNRATISNSCSNASTTTRTTRSALAICCLCRSKPAAARATFIPSSRPVRRSPIGTMPMARAHGAFL